MPYEQIRQFYPKEMGTAKGWCLKNCRVGFRIYTAKFASAKADMESQKRNGTLHSGTPPINVAVPVYVDSSSKYEHVVVCDKGTYYSDGKKVSKPTRVFGWGELCDGTRVVKYIDKPFFLGADGVKVLRSRFKDANYRYLYYALKNIRVPNTGYNRHFKWLKDSIIEYPDNASVVILSLKRLRNLDLEKSSYETYYSKEKSFVAIIKESLFNGDSTYVYFVHLVSCAKASCVAEDSQELEMNRGINLVREDDLQNSDRYELVLSGSDVKLDYLDQASTNYHEIKQKVSRSNAVYYE